MVFTKRFILLIGIGILILSAGYFLNFSFIIFILYNSVCFLLLIIDYFVSPSSEIFEVERAGEDKLSLFEEEEIKITVYNKSNYKIYIEMKDEIPDMHFEAKKEIIKGYISQHDKKIFVYFVRPTKRGVFRFGNIHVRYESKLKLCMKQFQVASHMDYKVYPNLKNLKKYRLVVFYNRKYEAGQKAMKMQGKGNEFESLREYVSGDEYRKINWNATARENKPIINQYEPEKNQHVYVLIDTGRPMSYTVRGFKKLDLAINTGLLLSDIANQNGDLSGLMVFNTEVGELIKPGKGHEHRHRLMEVLYNIEHNNNTSNYEEAFSYLKKKERRRSLICLFTDFETLEEAEEIMKVLSLLSKNNIVLMILIEDEKLEKTASIEVKNETDAFIKGVALELLRERKKIIHTLNAKGVMCIECPSEKLAIETINKYLYIKNRMYL